MQQLGRAKSQNGLGSKFFRWPISDHKHILMSQEVVVVILSKVVLDDLVRSLQEVEEIGTIWCPLRLAQQLIF